MEPELAQSPPRSGDRSVSRTMSGGRVVPTTLPQGEHGRALCRWCALEVPPGRRSFCSAWCVDEWRMRTDPGYLRDQVFARDRGICSLCQTDTVAAQRLLKRARGDRRQELLHHWNLKRYTRRALWDADHILPVVEGGGECDLNNMRTLCLFCHKNATEQLRARLKQARVRAVSRS